MCNYLGLSPSVGTGDVLPNRHSLRLRRGYSTGLSSRPSRGPRRTTPDVLLLEGDRVRRIVAIGHAMLQPRSVLLLKSTVTGFKFVMTLRLSRQEAAIESATRSNACLNETLKRLRADRQRSSAASRQSVVRARPRSRRSRGKMDRGTRRAVAAPEQPQKAFGRPLDCRA